MPNSSAGDRVAGVDRPGNAARRTGPGRRQERGPTVRAPLRGLPRPLLVLLACLTLAGCGITGKPAGQPFPSFTPHATVAVATSDTDGVQKVTLDGRNMHFIPQALRAHPGKVEIKFTNDDSVDHDLTLFTTSVEDTGSGATSTDAISTGTVKGHQTAVLAVSLSKPGTYKFVCRFHRDDGMFGELVIK